VTVFTFCLAASFPIIFIVLLTIAIRRNISRAIESFVEYITEKEIETNN